MILGPRACTALTLPLFALLSACGGDVAQDEERAPAAVEAVTVGTDQAVGSTPQGRSYPAILRRDRESNLSFRVAGTVMEMPVRAGMRLPAGALVARIDATPYAANLAARSADADRLARAAERYAALVPEGAVAEAQARDARDALAAARAAQVAARYDAASARLVAPFSGVVLSRRAEVGETVAPGQPVVVLADLRSPLLAVAQLPAVEAARLRPGMAAQVVLQGAAQWPASVLRIGGASDPRAGTVPVELRLTGAPPQIASGTPASVRIAAAGPDGASAPVATTIPAAALLEAQGDRAFVYVIDRAGKARRQTVRFLGFDDQQARVDGLPAGTRVITAGAGFVSEGQSVQVSGR